MQELKKSYEDLLSDTLVGSLFTCLTVELSKDYEALGGAYNAFSLNESGGPLPQAIERVGQASDSTYLSLQELVPSLKYVAYSRSLDYHPPFPNRWLNRHSLQRFYVQY